MVPTSFTKSRTRKTILSKSIIDFLSFIHYHWYNKTMDNKNYIAIDVGGTYARVACFKSLKTPLFNDIKVFKLSHNFEKDFENIKKIITEISKDKIDAIGVGLPGTLDESKSIIISAKHIPEWIDINVKEKLQKYFNCPIYLENDGVTSALGEAVYEENHKNDFIFIIWGTGIGGAVIKIKPYLKVEKLYGKDYPTDIRNNCGGRGLFEKYNKPLNELGSEDWNSIITDFFKLVVHVSGEFKIKEIVIGGGVALSQKEKIKIFSKKLKEKYGIYVKTTNFGDSHTFGLYGASALISISI